MMKNKNLYDGEIPVNFDLLIFYYWLRFMPVIWGDVARRH